MFSLEQVRIPVYRADQTAALAGRRRKHPSLSPVDQMRANGFRVTVIVLDGAGIGVMPNHPLVDDGANTIANVAAYYEAMRTGQFRLPNMQALGLGNIATIPGVPAVKHPAGSYGVLTLDPVTMTDTITGHWGLMGLNTLEYPTYLSGLPPELMTKIQRAVEQQLKGEVPLLNDGRNISGTTVLEQVGHQGLPIVYTSSDSVYQLAVRVGKELAPGESVPTDSDTFILEEKGARFAISRREVEKMYAISAACRSFMDESTEWGDQFLRVIARPFATRLIPGSKGEKFVRITSLRRDLTLAVPGDTVLDHALAAGYDTVSVGKFYDVFTGKGFNRGYPDPAEKRHLRGNEEGIDCTVQALRTPGSGIIGVNLVEFDEEYGHRNDPIGFGQALMAFDRRLPEIFAAMGDWDIVVITADHGNDPTRGLTKLWMESAGLDRKVFDGRGTNHTREFVPLLVFGNPLMRGINLGIHALADVGATAANYLGCNMPSHGNTFLEKLRA
ncbi:MAG: hypothetical protein NT099_08735 [Candidatus Saganbacteria bacterium]|nr:hypothetical protein [Candidatus Saganbacteria bacterium]